MNREVGKLDTISSAELRELWPDSDDGRLCARLLQRYAYSVLIQTAVKHVCTVEMGSAESAGLRAYAKMAQDFGELSEPPAVVEPRKPFMKPLNRFSEDPKPEKK